MKKNRVIEKTNVIIKQDNRPDQIHDVAKILLSNENECITINFLQNILNKKYSAGTSKRKNNYVREIIGFLRRHNIISYEGDCIKINSDSHDLMNFASRSIEAATYVFNLVLYEHLIFLVEQNDPVAISILNIFEKIKNGELINYESIHKQIEEFINNISEDVHKMTKDISQQIILLLNSICLIEMNLFLNAPLTRLNTIINNKIGDVKYNLTNASKEIKKMITKKTPNSKNDHSSIDDIFFSFEKFLEERNYYDRNNGKNIDSYPNSSSNHSSNNSKSFIPKKDDTVLINKNIDVRNNDYSPNLPFKRGLDGLFVKKENAKYKSNTLEKTQKDKVNLAIKESGEKAEQYLFSRLKLETNENLREILKLSINDEVINIYDIFNSNANAGYDILIQTKEREIKVEVKSIVSKGKGEIFISDNEINTLKDNDLIAFVSKDKLNIEEFGKVKKLAQKVCVLYKWILYL